MILNKRTVFLIDGIGALMSAIFTGILLPHFSEHLGLPRNVFYFLAVFPMIYFFFSSSCYFLVPEIRKWMLRLILLGNGLYCIVSSGIILFSPNIKMYGTLVLSFEILLVFVVMTIEFKVYRRMLSQKE